MKNNRVSNYWRLNPKVLKYWILRTIILAIIFAIVFQVFDLWAKRTHVYVISVTLGFLHSFYRARKEYHQNNT